MKLFDIDFEIDIGSNHWISYTKWCPDRKLNPHYNHIPDFNPLGIFIAHKDKNNKWCIGSIMFDQPYIKEVFPNYSSWQIISKDPLSILPSILCKTCGDHGYIKNGRWSLT